MNRNPNNTSTHKQCTRCKEVKERTEFYANRHSHDKLQGVCKPCNIAAVRKYHKDFPERHATYNREWDKRNPEKKKDAALKTRLGVKAGTYAKMFTAQGGRCAICQRETPGQRLHVDHCANSDVVRGLLCTRCNTGIGQLLHSEQLLLTAISYLNKFPGLPEGS